ncbi:hypothetical protein M3N64_11290 [Sporolactobacillus sp. CPB3-1]|uniref:Uncharacterized protein n=1 Tax=Sporolactobacillus mangiferae TaxID=2940498 RepID=A0ABT0MCB6_9BACL|nr:hypothetical protein [Sporolactobacillus mangiferae]MCL1632502.1 hypothetical protein [Sporolactobacillus mangiferae]
MKIRLKKPMIMVVGAPPRERYLPVKRKRKKPAVIRRCDQSCARVVFLNGEGEKLKEKELARAERSIARCRTILLLENAAVGIALQTASLASKHNVHVQVDTVPMLSLSEKIRRVARQITADTHRSMKKHTSGRKWRRRKA